MNIFYLDSDPEIAASYLCDKHVVKMIVESAQMLCTAHRELDDADYDWLYKSTHKNHPSAKWVRDSIGHYRWLYNHFEAMVREYHARYNRKHKTFMDKDRGWRLRIAPKNISYEDFIPPPLCMPEECKRDNTIKSYRIYYKTKTFAEWRYTEKPNWY